MRPKVALLHGWKIVNWSVVTNLWIQTTRSYTIVAQWSKRRHYWLLATVEGLFQCLVVLRSLPESAVWYKYLIPWKGVQYGIKITLETEIDALALRARVVYTIGFRGDLNPVLPSFSWYNLYLLRNALSRSFVTIFSHEYVLPLYISIINSYGG